MISMGGTSYISIEKYLENHAEITKITLCLDSDNEGNFFSQKIREKFGENYEINRHVPEEKDFNEELLILTEESSDKNVNSVRQDIIGEDCMV